MSPAVARDLEGAEARGGDTAPSVRETSVNSGADGARSPPTSRFLIHVSDAMKITRFAIGAPDAAGEVPTQIEVLATNPTSEDVHWTRSHFFVTDKDGFVTQSNLIMHGDDLSLIRPGGSATITPFEIKLWSKMVGRNGKGLILTASAVMHGRDVHRLGEVDVPAKALDSAMVEQEIESAVISGPVKVRVSWAKAGDGGDVQLSCHASIHNKSDMPLRIVRLESELVDSDGVTIDTASGEVDLPSRAKVALDGGWGFLKKSQLRSAKVRLTLFVYRPIHTAVCSASCPVGEFVDVVETVY